VDQDHLQHQDHLRLREQHQQELLLDPHMLIDTPGLSTAAGLMGFFCITTFHHMDIIKLGDIFHLFATDNTSMGTGGTSTLVQGLTMGVAAATVVVEEVAAVSSDLLLVCSFAAALLHAFGAQLQENAATATEGKRKLLRKLLSKKSSLLKLINKQWDTVDNHK
jgi:hypothetical protein